MVRDRQPAAGPHRQGGRAGPGAGRGRTDRPGGGHRPLSRRGQRRPRRAAGHGQPGSGAVPRGQRRRARPPLREHPPPPPAGRVGAGHRRHRAGASPARPGEVPGRRGGRHQRPQRPPAPRPPARAVRQRRRGRHADQRGVVRVQARAAARRRPGLRLPLPAQSPLGRRSPPPHRPRRAGARRTSPASPRLPSSWPSSTTCSACSCRPTSRRASPTCRSPSAARVAPTGRSTSPRSWPSCSRHEVSGPWSLTATWGSSPPTGVPP